MYCFISLLIVAMIVSCKGTDSSSAPTGPSVPSNIPVTVTPDTLDNSETPDKIPCGIKGFAHEMAHILGFYHVCGEAPGSCGTIPLSIGGDDSNPRDIEYSSKFQYHAKLAYQIGRGKSYEQSLEGLNIEDPRFDDKYWRELLYNDYASPGSFEDTHQFRITKVLSDPSNLNIYVVTEDWPLGLPNKISREIWLPWMKEQTPSIIMQLTGKSWKGRFDEGPALDKEGNWVVITVKDDPRYKCRAEASVGESPGIMLIDIYR